MSRDARRCRPGFGDDDDDFACDDWRLDGELTEFDEWYFGFADRFDDEDEWQHDGPDPFVREALRTPITRFRGWYGDWGERILPQRPCPKPKAQPAVCANAPCENRRESKLKKLCKTCRVYAARNGRPRPSELIYADWWRKAGDPDGTAHAYADKLIDACARHWLAREAQLMDGDERRAQYAYELARQEMAYRIKHAGIGGAVSERAQAAETSWQIEMVGGQVWVDQAAAAAQWKAVERRYARLKREGNQQ